MLDCIARIGRLVKLVACCRVASNPLSTTLPGMSQQADFRRTALGFAAWLVVCFGAAAVGGLLRPGDWYAQLEKPAWTPPNWLFGPVWTALYLMMAVAAWEVWRRGGFARQCRPLALFLIQLAFNALWSWFFSRRQLSPSSKRPRPPRTEPSPRALPPALGAAA